MYDECELFGQKFETKEEGCFLISQPVHISKLELAPSDLGFENLRFITSSIAWLYLTLPEDCCVFNKAA